MIRAAIVIICDLIASNLLRKDMFACTRGTGVAPVATSPRNGVKHQLLKCRALGGRGRAGLHPEGPRTQEQAGVTQEGAGAQGPVL